MGGGRGSRAAAARGPRPGLPGHARRARASTRSASSPRPARSRRASRRSTSSPSRRTCSGGPARQGRQVLRDLQNWVDGINAYEASPAQAGPKLPHAKLTDAIAGFAFIGSIFGNGGGNEVANSDFLARLERRLGRKAGTEGVPRPARGQRSRGADDDQQAVPLRRRAQRARPRARW